MRCAVHPILQVQVVGQHTEFMQTAREVNERRRRIVHTLEQYGLIEQQRPGAAQCGNGRGRLSRQFLGVVHVQHHGHSQGQGSQPLEECRIHALRQHHGIARMDAQLPHVRRRSERASETLQARGRERERITAAQDHLADRRVANDGLDRLLPTRAIARFLGIGVFAPKAVTAVQRAGARRDQQGAVGILVQKPRRTTRGRFVDGIVAVAGLGIEFRTERQHLA